MLFIILFLLHLILLPNLIHNNNQNNHKYKNCQPPLLIFIHQKYTSTSIFIIPLMTRLVLNNRILLPHNSIIAPKILFNSQISSLFKRVKNSTKSINILRTQSHQRLNLINTTTRIPSSTNQRNHKITFNINIYSN